MFIVVMSYVYPFTQINNCSTQDQNTYKSKSGLYLTNSILCGFISILLLGMGFVRYLKLNHYNSELSKIRRNAGSRRDVAKMMTDDNIYNARFKDMEEKYSELQPQIVFYLLSGLTFFVGSLLPQMIVGDAGLLRSNTSTMLIESVLSGILTIFMTLVLYVSYFGWEQLQLRRLMNHGVKLLMLFVSGFMLNVVMELSGFSRGGDDDTVAPWFSSIRTIYIYLGIAVVFVFLLLSVSNNSKYVNDATCTCKDVYRSIKKFMWEGLIMSVAGASFFLYMEINRYSSAGFKANITNIGEHFVELMVKFFCFHAILQLTGAYKEVIVKNYKEGHYYQKKIN